MHPTLQLLNFSQYITTPDSNIANVPSPLPPPYMLTAEDTKAPGFAGSCIARSTSAPAGARRAALC